MKGIILIRLTGIKVFQMNATLINYIRKDNNDIFQNVLSEPNLSKLGTKHPWGGGK